MSNFLMNNGSSESTTLQIALKSTSNSSRYVKVSYIASILVTQVAFFSAVKLVPRSDQDAGFVSHL